MSLSTIFRLPLWAINSRGTRRPLQSVLRFPRLFVLTLRHPNPARLPAMLSLLLVAVAVFQELTPAEITFTERSDLLPHRDTLIITALPPPDPEILRRPIFAPDRKPMA